MSGSKGIYVATIAHADTQESLAMAPALSNRRYRRQGPIG
jgi:hypothetical protein